MDPSGHPFLVLITVHGGADKNWWIKFEKGTWEIIAKWRTSGWVWFFAPRRRPRCRYQFLFFATQNPCLRKRRPDIFHHQTEIIIANIGFLHLHIGYPITIGHLSMVNYLFFLLCSAGGGVGRPRSTYSLYANDIPSVVSDFFFRKSCWEWTRLNKYPFICLFIRSRITYRRFFRGKRWAETIDGSKISTGGGEGC